MNHTEEGNKSNAILFDSQFWSTNPVESRGLPIIRTEAYDDAHNTEVLARNLDLTEKKEEENALIRMASYQK